MRYDGNVVGRNLIPRESRNLVLRNILRWVAYVWASPYTLSGITIGLLLGGRFRRVDGVIEIHGPLVSRVLSRLLVPALAMTWGHVVFGQNEFALNVTRRHERVHVRQYERWGPTFVPVYLLCSAWLFLRRQDGYRGNPFEVEAYAVDDPGQATATEIRSRDGKWL